MDYYDNIDDMTNLVYEFIYKSPKEYFCEKPKIEEIVFNDIIKSNEFDYSKILNDIDIKKNTKLIDIIEEKIILKKDMKKTYPLILIIQKYNQKFQETLSIIDIYYELYINYIVYEYVIFDKIPFYLLNICNFNIEYNKLDSILNFKKLVNEKFKNISDKDKYCISVYEHYNEYITLKEFLTTELTEYDILNILFQVLFAYSYFIYKIGSFRHNNFSIDCFLVEKLIEPITLYLKSGEHLFKLKTSFICKLFDYRKAQIYLLSNEIECDIDNPSYDIYTFLLSMYNFNNINKEKIKIIINELISEDIIKKNIKNENIFIKEYNGTILPNQLLIENNLFTRFIYMPTKQLKRSKSLKKNKNNSKKNKEYLKPKKKIQLKRSINTKKKSNDSDLSSSESNSSSDNSKDLKKNKKIVSSSSSSSSSDDNSSEKIVKKNSIKKLGIKKDDDDESIDDKNLDEEIENDIDDDDDDSDDDISDSDDNNNFEDGIDHTESDDMTGGLGTTDKKKIKKLKTKINKIKQKYNGTSYLNKDISKLKISKNNQSFGDFLGKNNNSSFNNINGGIPLTNEGLEMFNSQHKDVNTDMDMFSQPEINTQQHKGMDMFSQPDTGMYLNQDMNIPQHSMGMYLQPGNIQQPQNMQQLGMNIQQGSNMYQNMQQPQNMFLQAQNMQQPQNMFLQPQNMQQLDMNIQQGANMFPVMNGGKGKLNAMPILSNFFFHHK